MKKKFAAKRRRDLESEDNVNNNCDILMDTEDFNLQNPGKRKRRKAENLGNFFGEFTWKCLVGWSYDCTEALNKTNLIENSLWLYNCK